MKFIRYALVLSLLSGGSLFAATSTETSKKAKHKKTESHKQTHAKKETSQPSHKSFGGQAKSTAKDRYGKPKGSYKKMEMQKHEKGLRKPVTKPAAKVATKDRAAKPVATTKNNEQTLAQKAAGWLGLGAAGTAATQAIGAHREAGYHIGPRGWNHNFGPGWGNKGWVEGFNEHGNWVFAGYRPDWWKENYPTYYKDVIWPLYKQSAEYQKTVGK